MRSALDHLLNGLVWILRLESLLQVARVGVEPVQAEALIVNITYELRQILVPQIIGLVDHLVIPKELCRAPIEMIHLLVTRNFRRPLTRMRPRIEDRLVSDASLLRHLEQGLLGNIVLGGVLGWNTARLLVGVEVLGNFVLLNDRWWIDLRVLGLLLEEEAFGKVLLLTLEGGEVFN